MTPDYGHEICGNGLHHEFIHYNPQRYSHKLWEVMCDDGN